TSSAGRVRERTLSLSSLRSLGANPSSPSSIPYDTLTRYQCHCYRPLVWGPDPTSDSPVAKKRKEVRKSLDKLGHHVFFSEDLIFDKTYKVPANLQERVQVGEMDAVICLASDFGPMQEAQEFGKQAKEFLLWISSRARGTYTDSGLAQQLRQARLAPIMFEDRDLGSCVIAAASAEWVEQIRMNIYAIEEERKRLNEMAPTRGAS
ncbi:MAG: hypothetical protein Q7S58_10580, partial [Candidatus Binatus sp.]|uniref:hypothetical protein n=1 Tax=Candidatus Binatus sp. TaxID=2811406 RepID=UPI002719B8E2